MNTFAMSALAFALLGASVAFADTMTIKTVTQEETVIKRKTITETVINTEPKKNNFHFKICNESNSSVYLAIGYEALSAENDWHFKGWYPLEHGECYSEKVEAANRTKLGYAFHAHSSDGSKDWGDEVNLKMPKNKFDFIRYEKGEHDFGGKNYKFYVESAKLGGESVQRLVPVTQSDLAELINSPRRGSWDD